MPGYDNSLWRLFKIAEQGDASDLYLLNNVDINATNDYKQTALHLATAAGNISVVCYLLKLKTNVNAIDCNNNTPLHFAAKNGYFDLACKLIQAGACPYMQNDDGNNILHLVCASHRNDINNILQIIKLNIHQTNKSMQTPLGLALINENLIAATELIKLGALKSLIFDGYSKLGTISKILFTLMDSILDNMLKDQSQINHIKKLITFNKYKQAIFNEYKDYYCKKNNKKCLGSDNENKLTLSWNELMNMKGVCKNFTEQISASLGGERELELSSVCDLMFNNYIEHNNIEYHI